MLAQRTQSSLFWIAFSAPVRKLPLQAATRDPRLKTVITCPARCKFRLTLGSSVDFRVTAYHTWSGRSQLERNRCSSGEERRRSKTGRLGWS